VWAKALRQHTDTLGPGLSPQKRTWSEFVRPSSSCSEPDEDREVVVLRIVLVWGNPKNEVAFRETAVLFRFPKTLCSKISSSFSVVGNFF